MRPTVVQWLHFVPAGWRTMEQWLVALASHMDQLGWRTVHVFSGEPGPRMREALERLGSPWCVIGDVRDLSEVRQVAQSLLQWHPRVVQTHFLSMFEASLPILKRSSGAARLVVTDHASGRASRKSALMEVAARVRGRWVARYIDQVVGVSDYVCERAVRRVHLPARRVRCVHNGIDVGHFAPAPVEAAVAGVPVIGFIGQLIDHKGVRVLLRAAAELRQQGHEFELQLAGAGAQREEYEELVRAFGLEGRARFLGQIDRTVDFYRRADIVVVPSEWQEAFGLVAAEAGACGACVVTSDAGGLPEIVGRDGRSGVVFPAGDVQALVGVLSGLLGAPERRRALGHAARLRMVERFTLEASVQGHARALLDDRDRLGRATTGSTLLSLARP